jgi:fructoselysine-6-P-deglycase FrlB-like protein
MTSNDPDSAAAGVQTRAEIASQPEMWARVIAEAPKTSPQLPTAGEPVLILGCGTSWFIGDSYARRRNTLGQGRTRACVPTEIPYRDDAETVIVLSRSGTTTDAVAAARILRDRTTVIGIVGTPGTPLMEECHRTIVLDYADETSIVQTRFATSALTLLRASLGEDLSDLPDQARSALERELPDPPSHAVFLGTGHSVGLAHEAALKCREAAAAWTESYPIMEYQHGPIAAADSDTLVWPLAPIPDDLAAAITATGARLVTPTLEPQAELVAVHRLAVAMAERAGRDPDRPIHLTRSVQLA